MVIGVRQWLREVTGRAHAERVARGLADPWHRLDLEPPLRAFGPGAIHDFRHYLTAESRVTVASPGDVARWLLTCRYASDAHLLDEHDHWLHPATFELLRCGDCEDFALWGWRKLVECAYRAELVVGERQLPDGERGRHAWVVFRERGTDYLLDGVERSPMQIIRLLDEARSEYEPQVGVDADCRRFVFAGLYRTEWGRRLRLRRGRGE